MERELKKNIFFIHFLLTTTFLLNIKTSFSLENITYTCPLSIDNICRVENNTNKNDISKKIFGLSHKITKNIAINTSIKLNFIESTNIQEAIKKSSFKGKGQIKNTYSDLAIGIPFSFNKNIEYLFPPISSEKIVLIKINASKSINENILLNELKSHKIYITDEIELSNISNKIKKHNNLYYHIHNPNKFFNVEKLSNKESLKEIDINKNISIITSLSNYKLLKQKNSNLTYSKIKIRDQFSSINLFIAINKMSELARYENKNIVSKIKLILEEMNK